MPPVDDDTKGGKTLPKEEVTDLFLQTKYFIMG